METLRIALCEDDPDERQYLLSLIQSCAVAAQVSMFENGDAFLTGYQADQFDLILMDIYMSGISGVDVVRQIRISEKQVPIAFVTSSQDYALDGYRLHVSRYLEKPVSREAMEELLLFAKEQLSQQPGITLLSYGKPLIIPVRNLSYIEQNAHYLMFYLSGGQMIKSKGKLDDLMPQLDDPSFFRCHKSYLVNLAYVTGIDQEMMVFYMKEGNTVYIRRDLFKKAKNAWELWLYNMARKKGASQNEAP